jgi:hypothetical protein
MMMPQYSYSFLSKKAKMHCRVQERNSNASLMRENNVFFFPRETSHENYQRMKVVLSGINRVS